MYKPFVTNRIIDNEYEMYKNKLLYTALKNARPVTKASWHQNELPTIKKNTLLEMKDRNRIKAYLDIAQENLRFFSKLSRSKSSYNLQKQISDFAKNKKYSNNIRRCKNISMPKTLLPSSSSHPYILQNSNKNSFGLGCTCYKPRTFLKSPMSEMTNFVTNYNKNSKNSTGTNFFGNGRTLSGFSTKDCNFNKNNSINNNNLMKTKENNLSFSVSPYFTKMVDISGLGECCVEIIYQKMK